LAEIRLSKVDETNISDHSRLLADDICLFLWEYTAGGGFSAGRANDLIINLKKKPSERTTKGGWHYKGRAIDEIAAALSASLNPEWLRVATLVPAPPSKATDHPDYDDRVEQIVRKITMPPGATADIRPMIRNRSSRASAHESDERPTVQELVDNMELDEAMASSAPVKTIGIFDDMLTTGTTFRAMATILGKRFQGVNATGIFVARRAIPNPFAQLSVDQLSGNP
jgi:hypothetical protein